MFEKVNFKFLNFSALNLREKVCTQRFKIDDDVEWSLCVHNIQDHFGISLIVERTTINLPESWRKNLNFSLSLINQVDEQRTIKQGFEFGFSYDEPFCGSPTFAVFNEVNETNGFILNDTLVIETGYFFTKYVYDSEAYQYQHVYDLDDYPLSDVGNPFFHSMFIRSFPRLNPEFVPSLEKACLEHPLLLVSQEKRSAKYTEMAFSGLGRLLNFLRITQVKHVNHETLYHLEQLWDEAKSFGFDLSWMECNVKSALAIKNYLQNVYDVIKDKEHLEFLENQTKMMIAQLERTKLSLRETEERFQQSAVGFNLEYGIDTYLNQL